jgi:hypothetical protein
MHIGTLFPSARTASGETKGGVVVIKMNTNGGPTMVKSTEGVPTVTATPAAASTSTSEDTTTTTDGTEGELRLKMNLTYTDRDKEGVQTRSSTFGLSSSDAPYYQNRGVRKAVLLTQYVNLVRSLLGGLPINTTTGIPTFDPRHPPAAAKQVSEPDDTEGSSTSSDIDPKESAAAAGLDGDRARWLPGGAVRLPVPLRATVSTFIAHFESEMKELGDLTLRKELAVLQKFIADPPTAGPVTAAGGGGGVAANGAAAPRQRPFMMM